MKYLKKKCFFVIVDELFVVEGYWLVGGTRDFFFRHLGDASKKDDRYAMCTDRTPPLSSCFIYCYQRLYWQFAGLGLEFKG